MYSRAPYYTTYEDDRSVNESCSAARFGGSFGCAFVAAMYIDDLSGTGGSVGTVIGAGVGGGEAMPAMYANALFAICASPVSDASTARFEPPLSLRSSALSTGFASAVM